jgi:hypothetical protein
MALIARDTGRVIDAWPGSPEGATDSIALVTARNAYGREGTAGTIDATRTALWRTDRQKNIAGGISNLQVQRNGRVEGYTSVACVHVSNRYFFELDGRDVANREAELTRVLRAALTESWRSWVPTTEAGFRQKRAAVVKVFEISGDFSSPRPVFVSPQKPVT